MGADNLITNGIDHYIENDDLDTAIVDVLGILAALTPGQH